MGRPSGFARRASGRICLAQCRGQRPLMPSGASAESWARLCSNHAASTVMEAGLIPPQPGEEAAWFEHNRAQLSAPAPDGIKGL